MNATISPRMKAVDRAVTAYEDIKSACNRPDKSITGETLEIYKELVDWGFIEKYDISDQSNRWLYVVIIAMHLDKEDRNTISDSYNNNKPGKWQIIQKALEKTTKSKRKE